QLRDYELVLVFSPEVIEDGVEAVYIDGLISFSPEKINKFVEGLKIKRLPSISATGIKDVEAGIMIARSPSDFFMRRARRVAVNVQRILEGDDPEDIGVDYSEPKHITLNIETAKSVGIYPSWELITDIYLVGGEAEKSGPMLSLFSVVQEAINLNLDLKAREKYVQAGNKEIDKAWTNLLPNIDVTATGLQIDKDRAKASFGTQAEQTISGTLTLSQLLYSDEAWGNITIQKELQKSRENEFTQTKYDLIQETAVAYLNILRAKAFEQIQKDNLSVTQTNYETAKIRESIGSAGPGEIYRWEAEVASGQQAVISATVQREITEQVLNRILGYPINRKFSTAETDLNDKRLITSKDRLFNIINNPWVYDIFSDYLAAEAVKASPEIKILDAAIAAQERYYATTGRAFWLPTIAAQAQYDNVFERSGEGSNPKSLGITPPKDKSWSAAITATLPIFSGGVKFLNHQQAYLELQKLKTNRESLRQKIVQQTHFALKNSRYSGAKIRLSKKAAESAHKNLEIILDAYKNGAVSIIELLDAQNAMLVTDQVAANAEFDFLIDIMNVERAISRFDFFISDKDQEAWIDKFEAYYQENMRK
ncbi:MAG: TolC family protein, partial [Candidatus Odinarchaeota archaeon]